MKTRNFFEAFEPLSVDDEDRRLVLAAAPVLFLFALFFGYQYHTTISPMLSEAGAVSLNDQEQARNNRIYPVLVQQEYSPSPRSNQIRALSDVTAEGTGGITLSPGFHTLSDDDTLELGRAGQPVAASTAGQIERRPEGPGQTEERQADLQGASGALSGPGMHFRIPANYRFQEDLALRYDGSSITSVAREQLPGYEYFRKMLRQIRENFSPPGVNYILYDRFGHIINQPIKPQVVPVQFALDRDGNVIDVRLGPNIGQAHVNDACLENLRDRNFGPPPPEVFTHGNIFGINFIFPPVFSRL